MPQTNCLWQSDHNFEWDVKLKIVGDLKEIPGLLNLIGFPYDAQVPIGKNAEKNAIKAKHFHRDKRLLSNITLQSICRYVALDYCLFDFDPPAACRHELIANIASMNITVP